jgi:hypothetical protein
LVWHVPARETARRAPSGIYASPVGLRPAGLHAPPLSALFGGRALPRIRLMRKIGSYYDGTRFTQFSMNVAVAVAVCALCSALNTAIRAPIAPLLLVAVVGGAMCIASLLTRLWMPVHDGIPRFAGRLLGLVLSVVAAVISQSLDLTPGMGLLAAYPPSGVIAAAIPSDNAHAVRPLPIRSHPQSFLSHTHDPPVITFGK